MQYSLIIDEKIKKIKEAVAKEYDISVEDLKPKGKNRPVFGYSPINIVIYLAKTLIDAPIKQLCSIFGEDETSILMTYEFIKHKIEQNHKINKITEKLKEDLNLKYKMKCKFCGSENTREIYALYYESSLGIKRYGSSECNDCKRHFGYYSKVKVTISEIISTEYDEFEYKNSENEELEEEELEYLKYKELEEELEYSKYEKIRRKFRK